MAIEFLFLPSLTNFVVRSKMKTKTTKESVDIVLLLTTGFVKEPFSIICKTAFDFTKNYFKE
jgi:hypothetical protein